MADDASTTRAAALTFVEIRSELGKRTGRNGDAPLVQPPSREIDCDGYESLSSSIEGDRQECPGLPVVASGDRLDSAKLAEREVGSQLEDLLGDRLSDGYGGSVALTPAHALLNYAYAILETEATLAAYKVGFDPSLGLIHADVRYRSSLATDLMEPVRPIADGRVLELLASKKLKRGDVLETRQGACRIGSQMARGVAEWAPSFAEALVGHAQRLAQSLLGEAAAER